MKSITLNPVLLVRFGLPLLIVLTLFSILAAPVTEGFLSRWFQRDVELRSVLIYRALTDTLIERLGVNNNAKNLKKLFDDIARDEKVLGIALCGPDGRFIGQNSFWPREINCPVTPGKAGEARYTTLHGEKSLLLLGAFPLTALNGQTDHLLVLHDLTFSTQRTEETQLYLILFLIGFSLVVALVTMLTARITLRAWLKRLRYSLSHPEERLSNQSLPREFFPVVREVRQMLRDMRTDKYRWSDIKVEWTPQTLRRLLAKELPDTEVLIVSNREPYIHNEVDGKIIVQRPASGLVTALEPIIRACGGTWVAHGSGSADRQVVDNNNCIPVPPHKPEYVLRRIWLTPEEEDGYYYGFSNEGMWPLCHIAFMRPDFRETDWEAYKAVNRKFADAVVAQAKTKNPVVMVQDYHLALLPQYVREKLPQATILTFWHIPWPNPEVFSICPWREEILKGLLGSSVLGFHTQFHCQNFMDSVDRFLESHINREQSVITMEGRPTLVRPYPISIAWPPEGLEAMPDIATCRAEIRARYALPDNALIGVGVERFDYTKGIIDRFQAIRHLLQNHPEWRGRLTFIQAAAPTRSRLPAYQAIQQETQGVVDAINREFGTETYKPILLLAQHHEPEEVFRLFRAADFCVVSSLHDGMNLVAKEFVAARDDEQGVLILSTFAGASKEMPEALLVNPYDNRAMGEAIHRALTMPETEQRDRMHLMREMVRDNNVFYWAARIMFDAAHLRKRAHIDVLIDDRNFIGAAANGH
jgi:trehalose 6-phosphate synthase/phosphatase